MKFFTIRNLSATAVLASIVLSNVYIVSKISSNEPFGEPNVVKFERNEIKSPHNGVENLKVMLYVTTHMSPQHIWYLKSCWSAALQNSLLLRSSDVVVYLNEPENEREEAKKLLKDTFKNQKLTIHERGNPGYQEGAIAALADAAREGWFNGYDWVIRVNPDVIIRNDTFILDVMQNDPNATALLVNCLPSDDDPKVQTDFFAIKPGALAPNTFLNSSDPNAEYSSTGTDPNAEYSFTNDIRKDILDVGNHRWIKEATLSNGMCRVGDDMELNETPITHFHQEEELMNNFTCPIPF
jgi:hypothetical protein